MEYYAKKYGRGRELDEVKVNDAVFKRLEKYDFPGNVRELSTIIKGAVSRLPREENELMEYHLIPDVFKDLNQPGGNQEVISWSNLESQIPRKEFKLEETLDELKRRSIEIALKQSNNEQKTAAEWLGVNYNTFRKWCSENKTYGK